MVLVTTAIAITVNHTQEAYKALDLHRPAARLRTSRALVASNRRRP
jgi:hypothetical protein